MTATDIISLTTPYTSPSYTNFIKAFNRFLRMSWRHESGRQFGASAWFAMGYRLRVCSWGPGNDALSRDVLLFSAETCDINARLAIVAKLSAN